MAKNKMKLKNKLISALLASTLAWQSPVKAEESFFDDVACEARVDYLSKYFFRGLTYSEGEVMQGTLSLNKGPFTVIGFTNKDLTTQEVNETDVTFDYSQDVGEKLRLSTGYTFLKFPGLEPSQTQEVYAGATLKTFLNPSLKLVRDFEAGDGNNVQGTISHEVKVKDFPINLSATLGYNDHYFREDSGLSHLEMKASTSIPLSENLTLSPYISHSKSLDKDFNNETYAGIGLSYKF